MLGSWTQQGRKRDLTRFYQGKTPPDAIGEGLPKEELSVDRGLSGNNVHCLYFSLAGRKNGKRAIGSHDLGFRTHS